MNLTSFFESDKLIIQDRHSLCCLCWASQGNQLFPRSGQRVLRGDLIQDEDVFLSFNQEQDSESSVCLVSQILDNPGPRILISSKSSGGCFERSFTLWWEWMRFLHLLPCSKQSGNYCEQVLLHFKACWWGWVPVLSDPLLTKLTWKLSLNNLQQFSWARLFDCWGIQGRTGPRKLLLGSGPWPVTVRSASLCRRRGNNRHIVIVGFGILWGSPGYYESAF